MTGKKNDVGEASRDRMVEYMRSFKKERKYMPTLAEMARDLKLPRTAVVWHIEKLREQRRVTYEDGNMARSLRLR
jgi:predicted ArsR family transcriptional regulator